MLYVYCFIASILIGLIIFLYRKPGTDDLLVNIERISMLLKLIEKAKIDVKAMRVSVMNVHKDNRKPIKIGGKINLNILYTISDAPFDAESMNKTSMPQLNFQDEEFVNYLLDIQSKKHAKRITKDLKSSKLKDIMSSTGVGYSEAYFIGATNKDIFYMTLVWNEVPSEEDRLIIEEKTKKNLVMIQEVFNQSHKKFFHK